MAEFGRRFVFYLGVVVLVAIAMSSSSAGSVRPPDKMETVRSNGYKVVCGGPYRNWLPQSGEVLSAEVDRSVDIGLNGQLAKNPTLDEAISAIAKGNRLADPNLILAGQPIVLPQYCIRSYNTGY